MNYHFIKYALLAALSVVSLAHSFAQQFDYTEHPIFDPYSVVDGAEKAYQGADFNNMSAEEKENFYDSRIKANGRYPMNNGLNTSCQNYSKRFQLIFTGLENFDKFVGNDENNDGIKEGYDYYNPLVESGKENLPLYLIKTQNTEGVAHMVVGGFIGSKNNNIEDDARKFDQWVFYNYRTGEKVTPGDEMMDENGPVDMARLIYYEPANAFMVAQILNFELKDGVATLSKDFGDPLNPQGFDSRLLKNNPHHGKIKLSSIEDKVFTSESDVKIEVPLVETNLNDYFPKIETIMSDTVKHNDKHYSFKVTNIAKSKVGRWNSDPASQYFLGNLADTSSYIIDVDFSTGIEELNAAKSFDLDQNYPNPVNDITTVPYASQGGDLDFKLIDMQGKVHRVIEKDGTFMGEGEFQLDMNGMKPGQYVLFGNDEKGSVDKIKINHF